MLNTKQVAEKAQYRYRALIVHGRVCSENLILLCSLVISSIVLTILRILNITPHLRNTVSRVPWTHTNYTEIHGKNEFSSYKFIPPGPRNRTHDLHVAFPRHGNG